MLLERLDASTRELLAVAAAKHGLRRGDLPPLLNLFKRVVVGEDGVEQPQPGRAGRAVGVVNLDAHLDVRPFPPGQGHSGSPFRQALEHPTHPLPGDLYCCLGAQPFGVFLAK